MKNLSRFILFTTFAPAAFSQNVLFHLEGDMERDIFGYSVSGVGDVNGDGYDDVIVGAPSNDDHHTPRPGFARVYSGLDGSIIHDFPGKVKLDYFGKAVSGAGDVNGDGFPDLLIGAPGDDDFGNRSGSARVFSGRNGKKLFTFFGDSSGDVFGSALSGAGDVDGDGFDDVIIGARGDDKNGEGSGSAEVYSGADGSVLYAFVGTTAGDALGYSVSSAGDVNADGYADVIVGVPFENFGGFGGLGGGMVRVYSGLDGSVLHTFDGNSLGQFVGFAVSGAGDVNGDGYDDLVVGAQFDDTNGPVSGSVLVFSGLDGSILYIFRGDGEQDRFGVSVSGAGDVDGDGFSDVIVGAHQFNADAPGYSRVFSGADGSILHTFRGDSKDDVFGFSVSGAGDANGDGYDDLIVGAYLVDIPAGRIGSARVFSGWSLVGTTYCGPAVPNSTGLPAAILALGSDTAIENQLWLRASQLPPNKNGYFLASQIQGFVSSPGNSQGNLCLSGSIARFKKSVQNSGPSGTIMIQVDLTNIPASPPHTVLAGETWNFQAWYRDSNPGSTSNFTAGISVLFQ